MTPKINSKTFERLKIADIRKSRCTTGINDTSGKFQIATGINDTGGKFAAGVVDTGGKKCQQYQAADTLK
jgi:hypothetical protein